MNLSGRLKRLETRAGAQVAPVVPLYTEAELVARLREEIAAGHVEERLVRTGDDRPAYTYLAYRYDYEFEDYRYTLEVDALAEVLHLIEWFIGVIKRANDAQWPDDLGHLARNRPQSLVELSAWLDELAEVNWD